MAIFVLSYNCLTKIKIMKYYMLDPVLSNSPEFCETDKVPDGVRHLSFMMAKGEQM
jgi:hypothetical protein